MKPCLPTRPASVPRAAQARAASARAFPAGVAFTRAFAGVTVLAGALAASVPGAAVASSSRTAARAPLLVYAGAGFRLPIEEAACVFGERESLAVEVTFAGSGCLLAQAELAGRGDLLIPGEIHYLRQAQERGLAGPAVPLAILRPVIAVAKGNPRAVRGLVDLARRDLRVGLGDPKSVAVGLAAERWIADALAPPTAKAVLANVRTRALNVNELGTQLALCALDAVVVWDATLSLFPALEAVPAAGSREHPTVITGAVLTFSRQEQVAERFLTFLSGPEGRAIFRKRGYEPYDGRTPLDGRTPVGDRRASP